MELEAPTGALREFGLSEFGYINESEIVEISGAS